MIERSVGCVVITVAGAAKGIISDRDLLACLAQAHDPYHCPVSVHMKHPVIVLGPEESTATAANVMREKRIKRLPVAKNGKLLGIVSLSDLAAVAREQALQLRESQDFFAAVVTAQSAQSSRLQLSHAAELQRVTGAPAPPLEIEENDSAFVNAGGPG
jgi:signal-transduction protein with cAMP-binding, CBS, and nucleotidyltransferase domain